VTSVITDLGTLDLDHIGTEIGEHHGAIGTGHDAREIEHANTGQRSARSGWGGHGKEPLALRATGFDAGIIASKLGVDGVIG
jgi:hypothetical protein